MSARLERSKRDMVEYEDKYSNVYRLHYHHPSSGETSAALGLSGLDVNDEGELVADENATIPGRMGLMLANENSNILLARFCIDHVEFAEEMVAIPDPHTERHPCGLMVLKEEISSTFDREALVDLGGRLFKAAAPSEEEKKP